LENFMKIGNPADKPSLTPTTTARAGVGDGAKTQPPAVQGEASAQVVLSDSASALMSTSAATAAKADFDADKVERIGKAIADGKYIVNHGAVADKLIANAAELLSKHSR
jgi:negative regulator of flagellin synthesis FlgM